MRLSFGLCLSSLRSAQVKKQKKRSSSFSKRPFIGKPTSWQLRVLTSGELFRVVLAVRLPNEHAIAWYLYDTTYHGKKNLDKTDPIIQKTNPDSKLNKNNIKTRTTTINCFVDMAALVMCCWWQTDIPSDNHCGTASPAMNQCQNHGAVDLLPVRWKPWS